MDKHITRACYLLGMACFLVAALWRVANALGLFIPGLVTPGQTVFYMSFYKAGLMFLLMAIATVTCSPFISKNP